MLLIFILFLTAVYADMTEEQVYQALYSSLSALEAEPSELNTARIDMILKSTDFLRLQEIYGSVGSAKKKFQIST